MQRYSLTLMKVLTLCRTSLAFDINANCPEEAYEQKGRGNLAPHTLGLPIIALRSKKIQEKEGGDLIEIFLREFDKDLQEAKESLDIRYKIMVKQPPSCARFMYENNTILDGEKCVDTVEPALKHCSLAIGYVGVAEMCKVLFGKYHNEDDKVLEFAVDLIKRMKKFCDNATQKEHRNYSVYATPAESLCQKVAKAIKDNYGVIEGVSDREYVTNSHHVPVWIDINPFKKVDIESKFATLATGGFIFHYEVDGTNVNIKALTKVINYALDNDIPYMRLSHKTCTCLDCGYKKEAFMEKCEECGSENIELLSTITGYLTVSVNRMNKGKQQEVMDRVIHQ